MPELPEVESVRRSLEPSLYDRCIRRVEVLFPGAVQNVDAREFAQRLVGECFDALERYGKYLVFRYKSELFMMMHLRMTGRALVVSQEAPVDPHCRLRFMLDNDSELRFSDVRKFGRVALAEDRTELSRLFTLGPEPLTDAFTPQALAQALRGRTAVKGALLDQHRVAGLGNIYVDEALFRAGIHPARTVDTLDSREIARLHSAIEDALREALDHGGTTIRNYVQADGQPGDYAQYLLVYGRAGEPCRQCGGSLERTRVAGRGTTFCPHCQR